MIGTIERELNIHNETVWIFEHQRQKLEFKDVCVKPVTLVRSDHLFLRSYFFYVFLVCAFILKPRATFFLTMPRKLTPIFIKCFHSRVVFIEDGVNALRLVDLFSKNHVCPGKIRWLGSARSGLILQKFNGIGLQFFEIAVRSRIVDYLDNTDGRQNLVFLSKPKSTMLSNEIPFLDATKKTKVVRHPSIQTADECIGYQEDPNRRIIVIGNSAVALDLLIRHENFEWYLSSCDLQNPYLATMLRTVERFCEVCCLPVTKAFQGETLKFHINEVKH